MIRWDADESSRSNLSWAAMAVIIHWLVRAGARVRKVARRAMSIGRDTRDRRLLRRAVADDPGRVLVVGPSRAARRLFGMVDVAGTDQYSTEITVCSAAVGAGTLPAGRWDTIVVTEPGRDLSARLDAVLPACRARLVIVERRRHAPDVEQHLRARADVRGVVGGARRRVWVATPRPASA